MTSIDEAAAATAFDESTPGMGVLEARGIRRVRSIQTDGDRTLIFEAEPGFGTKDTNVVACASTTAEWQGGGPFPAVGGPPDEKAQGSTGKIHATGFRAVEH